MNIFIITMDDPVQTHAFIKTIIDHRKNDIVGVAISKGDRLRINKKKSKLVYIASLLLIMGIPYFLTNSFVTLNFKLKKLLSRYGLAENPSILSYAQSQGIQTFDIKTPNNKEFIEEIKKMNIDVIINQSQSIIKKELLKVPKIGVINRHNALLPKNRGRLTPFWVLYKGEKETGVSIHFLDEAIDAGEIIVQKRFPVARHETFRTLVRKNYQVAPVAMLEALDKLEKGENSFLPNNAEHATYNSTPTFLDALRFRLKRRMLT